jgi:hypothetical protein
MIRRGLIWKPGNQEFRRGFLIKKAGTQERIRGS